MSDAPTDEKVVEHDYLVLRQNPFVLPTGQPAEFGLEVRLNVKQAKPLVDRGHLKQIKTASKPADKTLTEKE